MAPPQQPELKRSGLGATDPASVKSSLTAAGTPTTTDAPSTVPEDNRPGHHPEHEQDKPEGPPRAGVRRRKRQPKPVGATGNQPEKITITTGGMTFRALAAGPEDGELVMLLHGFPQSSSAWRPQLSALAVAGYRAIAPDQRGYSPDARPTGTNAYRLDRLVGDVTGMATTLERGRFHVVGHDWGGIVAWALASAQPASVATLTVISTPHPQAYLDALRRSLQGLRSVYIGFFAVPGLPELALGGGGQWLLRRVLANSGLPPEMAQRYADAMAEPGALTAALNWYRALRPRSTNVGPITAPTTYLWSDGDVALGRAAAEATANYVSGPYRFEVLNGVSHWIPETRPDDVTRLVLEQVSAG